MTDAEALYRLYWFYKMIRSGGPDFSDLDHAVWIQAAEAAEWIDHGRRSA